MIPPTDWLAIDWALAVVVAWIIIGAIGVVRLHDFFTVARVLFPLGAIASLGLAAAGAAGLSAGAQTAVLPLGLPGLPFHLRLDELSAFFLLLLGSASAGISAFAAGYFRMGEGTPPGLLCLQYHLFLSAMAMVMLADDAYVFMVMWELMALASFFLVTANHVIPAIRRAGYLYLLVAMSEQSRFCWPLVSCRPTRATTRSPTCARRRYRRFGLRWRSCSRCSGSAPRPASCRCMSGCPRPILRRHRQYRP